jgi:hypothetical protein
MMFRFPEKEKITVAGNALPASIQRFRPARGGPRRRRKRLDFLAPFGYTR